MLSHSSLFEEKDILSRRSGGKGWQNSRIQVTRQRFWGFYMLMESRARDTVGNDKDRKENPVMRAADNSILTNIMQKMQTSV